MGETAGIAKFVAQIGNWPNPESRLYANEESGTFIRYDYDTDAWTVIAPYGPWDPPKRQITVQLAVPKPYRNPPAKSS